MNWFKFVGLSIAILNGGQAIYGFVTGSYLLAGIFVAGGLIWLWLIEVKG